MWEKIDGVRDSFVCGVICIHGVASITIRCWVNVPTIISVCRRTSSYWRFIVDDDFCAAWCSRRAVEVEGAVELGVGGEFWVDP